MDHDYPSTPSEDLNASDTPFISPAARLTRPLAPETTQAQSALAEETEGHEASSSEAVMPEATADQPPYPSPEERVTALQAFLEDDLVALIEELREDAPSEHLQRFLEFSARFYRYSPTNQLLIAMQRPDATRVASYKAWEAMGYHVAKGEKGIKIFVPLAPKRIELDPETGEERVVEGKALSFTTGAVFDATQLREDELEAHPLPEFFEYLGDDPLHLAERVEQVIVEDGISVEEGTRGEAVGYSKGGVIGVRPNLDEITRAQTLIHEYAHEKMHQGNDGRALSREVKEQHAEAVTYIVCRHLGLPTPASADYLRLCGATPRAILSEMRPILLTASRMIEAIHRLDASFRDSSSDPSAHSHRSGPDRP